MLQESSSLQGVIKRIKEIAVEKYENKIYDNILNIFNHLTGFEQKILLKGLINVCFIIEDKALVDTETLSEVREKVMETERAVADSVQKIDELNKLENVRFKWWFAKLMIGIAIGAIIVILAFGGLLNIHFFTMNEMTEPIYKMFEIAKVLFFGE